MATPESKIKRTVTKRLAAYPAIWRFMPVQAGFGSVALDYLLCVPTKGRFRYPVGAFVVIETKKKGGKLTPRQEGTKAQIERAGAKVFVVEDEDSLNLAMAYIHGIYEP